jgi:hypothetical protein
LGNPEQVDEGVVSQSGIIFLLFSLNFRRSLWQTLKI